jgi:hypothetical protein
VFTFIVVYGAKRALLNDLYRTYAAAHVAKAATLAASANAMVGCCRSLLSFTLVAVVVVVVKSSRVARISL